MQFGQLDLARPAERNQTNEFQFIAGPDYTINYATPPGLYRYPGWPGRVGARRSSSDPEIWNCRIPLQLIDVSHYSTTGAFPTALVDQSTG